MWASSSMSATSGCRARTASTSISSNVVPRCVAVRLGHDLEVLHQLERLRPAVRLDEADHDVAPPLRASPALVEHRARLADAGDRAEVDPELPRGDDDVLDVPRRLAGPLLVTHRRFPRP